MIIPESKFLGTGIGKRRLYYLSIVFFLLGSLSLYTGFNGAAPSVILFGIIQLFSALLVYCLFFARSLFDEETEAEAAAKTLEVGYFGAKEPEYEDDEDAKDDDALPEDERRGKEKSNNSSRSSSTSSTSGASDSNCSSSSSSSSSNNDYNDKKKKNKNKNKENRENKKQPAEPYKLETFLRRDYFILLLLASLAGIFLSVNLLFNLDVLAEATEVNLLFMGIAVFVLSFGYLFVSNWFAHYGEESPALLVLARFLKAAQVTGFLSGIALAVRAYGFYQVEYLLVMVTAVFLSLSLMEVAFIAVNRLLVKDEDYYKNFILELHILPALLSGKNPIEMLLLSLERRSGISIRSAWTFQFVRRSIIPLSFAALVLFWLFTGLVQINPDEKGVVYRLGQQRKDFVLEPGLHLKFPWPVDNVAVLPAYGHHRFSVGYEGDTRANYLWTTDHAGGEYSFLLGDGRELVSVNMLVTYRISDVFDYLNEFDDPVSVLQGKAYEILLQEVVKTDLDGLLTRDRARLAQLIHGRLQSVSEEMRLGMDVVDIALPSIHPPVAIARDYQEFVGAQIQKQILITDALADANHNLPLGEEFRERQVAEAKIKAVEDLAAARSEEIVSEAQLEAFRRNPLMYRQMKWLGAFERAVAGKNIYLITDSGDIRLDMRDLREIFRWGDEFDE